MADKHLTRSLSPINILTDKLISFQQVIKLPWLQLGRREGKPLAVTTVYRWANQGIRNLRLPTTWIGARQFTTEAAVREFIETLNVERAGGRLSETERANATVNASAQHKRDVVALAAL